MSLPVYKREFEDGLAEKIRASASIAYLAQIGSVNITSNLIQSSWAGIQHPQLALASADGWDLFGFNSVLASIGINKNDDVFDAGETWAAKDTPVFKPVNFMHNETDIIGVMTASVVVDPQGNIISPNADSIPSQYDLVVSSFLYRKWSDPVLQARMDKTIAEIQQGKWFVSMECLFKNFDYALVGADGTSRVVARDENTAFLTKHLRAYGGTGEFDGDKVCRVLRNFIFSGKGIVDNPANTRSVIFAQGVNPFKVKANTIPPREKNKMSEQAIIDQLKNDLAKASARSDKLESRLEEMVEAARKSEQDRLEKQIAALNVDVEDSQKEITTLKAELATRDQKIATLEAEAKASAAKLAETEAQVAKVEAEKVKATRVSQLVAVKVTAEEAAVIVEKWKAVSDEQFADIVKLHESKAEFPPKDEDKKDKKDKKDDKSDASVDVNDGNADADLDDAKADADPNLGVDDSNKVEELRASASAWFGTVLKKNKAAAKAE